jgi:hypothetical protein
MKPLILDYKEIRQETPTVVNYEYDFSQSLNIVKIDGEKKPFIDLNNTEVELLTKTKVHRENDDNHFLFELSTKTEVRKEMIFMMLLLNLKRKRLLVVKEMIDDQNSAYNE